MNKCRVDIANHCGRKKVKLIVQTPLVVAGKEMLGKKGGRQFLCF